MNPPGGRASAAGHDAGETVPPGLLAKLMSTVRPEFRADVLIPDPADLVFGGQPCQVAGCGRPGRARGLCHGHHHRWSDEGKPDIGEFIAATRAWLRGRSPLLPCRVAGCGFGRRRHGLCSRHDRAWRKAGQPAAETWLSQQPPVRAGQPPAACRIGFCTLWSQGGAGLCGAQRIRR